MAEAFPISGSIDPQTFPFLLMDLHRQGATGSLKVDGPSYQKALYYRGGRILFGSSNDPRDQLGAILIEGGKISPEQLEDVNTKVGPGNPLAKVLSESGFVNQRELSEAARAKVERILGDVIAYGSGTFDFEDGVLPKGAVDLKLSTERLILAAVRRIADRGFVLRHLENLDVVLAPTQDSASRLPEIQGEDGGLADQLDGRKNLRTAASQIRLDEFEAAKVACGLLFLGLAERSTGASPVDEAPLFVAPEEPELDLVQTARMAFSDPVPATVIMPASADATVSAPPIEPSRDPAFYVPAPPPAPPPAAGFAMVKPGAPTPSEEQPTRPVPVREASSARLPLVPPPSRTPEPPAPPSQSTSRPSKEDLAALDALLNSRAIEGPLAPLEKPAHSAPPWEPRFGSPAPKARPSGGGRAVVLGALAAFVAVGAAVAWYFFFGPGATGGSRVAQTRRTPPPVPITRPAPTTLPSPSPEPSPIEPVESPATGSVPPPGAAPSVAPSLRPSPVPTAVPTPAPTPSPKAPPSPKAGGGAMALADARGLLERGDLAQAARGFAANVKAAPGGAFSVQVLVACSDETVQKAVQNVPDPELYILPVNFKGRSCYRVCWGIYDSEAKAESATRSVPDYFRKGGASPKVVPTSNILP